MISLEDLAGAAVSHTYTMYLDPGEATRALEQDREKHIERNPMRYQFLGVSRFRGEIKEAIKVYRREHGKAPKRFLDVGSGIGATLFLASDYFEDAHGVELREDYITIFNWLKDGSRRDFRMNVERTRTFQGWAEEFEHYADYDVVYHFNISYPDPGQPKIRDILTANMREGAVLIDLYPPSGCGKYTIVTHKGVAA